MHTTINVQFFDKNNIFIGERRMMRADVSLASRATLAIFMRNGQEIRRVKLV